MDDEKGVRKHFFAAGWQNENSGWEVRNKYFKGCMGHKGITIIAGNPKKVAVFEGFINYLSWRLENPLADHSIIVLNTLAMLQAGMNKAKMYSTIDVYFDRDKPGYLATKDLIKALPYATDRSNDYNGYNDYNDKIKAQLKSVEVEEKSTVGLFANVKIPFIR